jgi:hypothetical protein
MTVEANLRLAADFAYTPDQEAEIVRLCTPLPSPSPSPEVTIFRGIAENIAALPHMHTTPEKIPVLQAQQYARTALADYARGPAEGNRAHEVAELAARLAYFVGDELWLYEYQPIIGDLRSIEAKARTVAAKPRRKTSRRQDEVRAKLTSELLTLQAVSIGARPTLYRNGAAAQLLLAAINPVMQYARQTMGVGAAVPLNADNAVYLIRLYSSGKLSELIDLLL